MRKWCWLVCAFALALCGGAVFCGEAAAAVRIKDIVSVDLPAVRTLAMKHDAGFVALESRIWRLIEEEAARTGMIAAA